MYILHNELGYLIFIPYDSKFQGNYIEMFRLIKAKELDSWSLTECIFSLVFFLSFV